MTQDQHGNGSVHWRDLIAERERIYVEIDRRMTEHLRLHAQEDAASSKALELAREGVLKHDQEKNDLLGTMARDRGEFARKDELTREAEKLALSTNSEMEKLSTRLESLEKAANIARGKDLGLLGLAGTLGGVIAAVISAIVKG